MVNLQLRKDTHVRCVNSVCRQHAHFKLHIQVLSYMHCDLPIDYTFCQQTQFDIAVASELMAILALSTSLADMKERIGQLNLDHTILGMRHPIYTCS